ncbi:MAG: hypothetical protein ACRC2J_01450 [Microcoleaceae cyanobacterium]
MKEKLALKKISKILISLVIISSNISFIETVFLTRPAMARGACGQSFHVKAYETKESFIYICPGGQNYIYVQVDKKTGRSMRLPSARTQDGFQAVTVDSMYMINNQFLVIRKKGKLIAQNPIIKVYQAGEKVSN